MYSKITLSIKEDVQFSVIYGKLIKEPVVLVYLIYIQVCNIMKRKMCNMHVKHSSTLYHNIMLLFNVIQHCTYLLVLFHFPYLA